MELVSFLVLLVIAAVAGSIGQAISGYSLGGFLMSILVGFIGAYLGLWLAGQFGLPEPLMINIGGRPFPVLWAILGSAVFTGVLGLVFRRRRLV